jgi:CTP:molybdopterin cytidylyltransferase MocA
MGYPKQLLMHEGEPLVRRAAIAAAGAGAAPVIVVLGADADQIGPALTGLPSVTTVFNRDWQTGLASSLAAGLRELTEKSSCDGVLVVLGDQPLVDAPALERLLAAFDSEHRIIASEYDQTMGVPVVFGREHVAELMRLTGDSGAGRWLRARAGTVTRVPLQGAAMDVDTPQDVDRLEIDANER